MKKLQRYNKIAFALHFLASCFMAPWLRLPVMGDKYEEWEVHATYNSVGWNSTSSDQTKNECGKDECSITQCIFFVDGVIRLETMVFCFHFGSAVAHFVYAYKSKDYFDLVKKSGNVWRWYEYAVTAAIMIVVIMVTMGITSLWELVYAAVMTAVTQYFGWLSEQMVQDRKSDWYNHRWRAFSVGCVLAVTPWVGIAYSFIDSVNNSKVAVPWFVWVIVIGLFVGFSSFAVVMMFRLKDDDQWPCLCCRTTQQHQYLVLREPYQLNIKAEKWYILLSFVSKALLAFTLWFGAFRRNSINLRQAALPPCL